MSTDETVRAAPVDDAPADAPVDAPVPADDDVDAPDGRLRYWHRDHPVFTPLAGFFTGVLLVVALGGLMGAILDLVLGYDVGEHPWILLVAVGVVLVGNVVLLALPGTRRFARYMLFGVLSTPAVIAVVASLTFWLLLQNDG